MLKDEIKHRPCVLGEFFEKLSEFAVKVTKKEQGLFAEYGKARIVDRPNRILRLEQSRHHGRKLLRQRLRIRRRLQGKSKRKVVLVCHMGPPSYLLRRQRGYEAGHCLNIFATAFDTICEFLLPLLLSVFWAMPRQTSDLVLAS